jgi:hypothetical protein
MIGRKTIALAVGLSRYQTLRPLSSAANDARDIAAVISNGNIQSEVKLLVDDGATKETVLQELDRLATSASSEDTVFVFFAGHGWRLSDNEERAYFCPFEAALSNLDETCLTNHEFTEALRAIKSARLLVLLDTCHAGAIGEPRNLIASHTTPLVQRDLDTLVEGKGRVILAASRPEEEAWELMGMGNGLFTSFLLRALSGSAARADGRIWVSDLFGYISRNVRRFGCQHTYQKAVGEDFVVMVRHPKALKQTTFVPGKRLDQRALRRHMHSSLNRAELSLLCHDLGLTLEDLSGTTLEAQIMELIDYCYRHGIYDQLVQNTAFNHVEAIA